MTGLLTAVASILVFGTVILIHELGHYLMAKRCGIQVNEFSIGMGPGLFHFEKGGTTYSIRLFPVGGYVSMEGEDEENEVETAPRKADGIFPITTQKSFTQATPGERMRVLAAGAFMNFVLGFAVLALLISRQNLIATRQIHSFEEGALCAQTGLQAEDTILSIDGHRCFSALDMNYELQRMTDLHADFTVRRAGKTIKLENVQFDTVEENGRTRLRWFTVYGLQKNGITVSIEAAKETFYFAKIVLQSFADLASGRAKVNDLSGPVGIVSAIGAAVQYGLDDVLWLMALITINLGIFNILPLPALDGGKLTISFVELVTHRAVPEKVQLAINTAGMVLLLGIMLFATFQDILRLI